MLDFGRRQFLKLGSMAAAGASLAFTLPSEAMAETAAAAAAATNTAASAVSNVADRVLQFYNTHTGEKLTTTFWSGGEYVSEALRDVNFILRDFRANEIKTIEVGLLDLLHRLNTALETTEPFHIISGYRTIATNAMLQGRHVHSGVASHSLHIEGKAIDIRVPGRSLTQVRRAALALQAGGVGYYPSSDFVHVDIGRVRMW